MRDKSASGRDFTILSSCEMRNRKSLYILCSFTCDSERFICTEGVLLSNCLLLFLCSVNMMIPEIECSLLSSPGVTILSLRAFCSGMCFDLPDWGLCGGLRSGKKPILLFLRHLIDRERMWDFDFEFWSNEPKWRSDTVLWLCLKM